MGLSYPKRLGSDRVQACLTIHRFDGLRVVIPAMRFTAFTASCVPLRCVVATDVAPTKDSGFAGHADTASRSRWYSPAAISHSSAARPKPAAT